MARRLQSAFRRKKWRALLHGLNTQVGGCYAWSGGAYRPLVDKFGSIIGVKGPSGRWYIGRTFGCLSPLNPVRALFILLIEHPLFDPFILLAIFANCFVLAVSGRPADSMFYVEPTLSQTLELAFTWFFTVEIGCKAIALGIFVDAYHSLLSDPWNVVDLAVVTSAWLPLLFPALHNRAASTSLRALRAFRPLRAAHFLPGVRRQVNTLLKALPSLRNVFLLIFFITAAFSILGMQLFKGSLHFRCYDETELQLAGLDDLTALLPGAVAPAGVEPIDAQVGVCNPTIKSSLPVGDIAQIIAHTAGGLGPLGNAPRHTSNGGCVPGVCLHYGQSPRYGTLSFDNIGSAMMTVFMCITGEGWTEVMYMTMRGYHPASALYFIFLALFGSFFVINLFLAVLWETYASLPQELTPEEQVEKRKWQIEHADDDSQDESEEPLVLTTNAEAREAWLALPRALSNRGGIGGRRRSRDGLSDSFRARARHVVTSDGFRLVIMVLILANTVLMMCETHPQPQRKTELIELGNLIFFGCYTLEMLIKLTVLGLAEYLAEPFNRFDGAIVILSGAEIVMSYLHLDYGLLNAQVLRTFRLLRIFKLARSWNNLYVVISSLLLTLAHLRDLLIVLLLWLFVCALLGMQLFGGGLLSDHVPRDMYDSIEHAMFTVFIVVTGEQWNEQWREPFRMLGLWTGAYYVMLVVTGDYIILNLVVAIVIREVGKADAYIRRLNNNAQSLAYEANATVRNRKFSLPLTPIVPLRDHFEEEEEGAGGEGGAPSGGLFRWASSSWSSLTRQCGECGGHVSSFAEAHKGHSLWLFAPESCVRRGARWILSARLPGFPSIGIEALVIASIIASSCVVALDAGCTGGLAQGLFASGARLGSGASEISPSEISAGRVELPQTLVTYLSIAMLISLFEIVCKAVAFGLVGSREAYLSSGWNQLDLFIALLCVGELIETGMPNALVLRTIHVLRPIRLIARHGGMQRVVRALHEVLPRVFNILLVYGLFLSVFAVLGMQLFGGKFGSCASDPSLPSKAACEAAGETWEARPELGSFDNIGDAMLMLFEVSSLEGWPNAMYLGVDSVGVDLSRQTSHNLAAGLFYVVWVLLGGFVVLNVFVGVLIDTFAKMENADRFGGVFTSHQQQHWVETLEASTSVKPHRQPHSPRGGSACRRWLFHHVTSPATESFIVLVILVNSLLMAADGYGIAPSLHAALDVGNDVCTAIFVVEVLLKFIALGVSNYLSEGWNVFDSLVVTAAVVEKLLQVVAAGHVKGSFLRLVRLARAARVLRTLRMIKASRSIQSLLMTLLYSVPALLNILFLFCILVFVYAVLGMELFSGVVWGDYLNTEANFCSFGTAALTMFRCATGEDWNGIMHDAMVTEERGTCDAASDNCGTWVAIPFFVSYTVLSSMVILKMLIALIIENYKLSKREDSRLVRTVHRDAFVEAWAKLDPEGVGQLPVRDLFMLIKMLPPPLGLDPTQVGVADGRSTFRSSMPAATSRRPGGRRASLTQSAISTFIMKLDLVLFQPSGPGGPKVVLFHDVLLALTTNALRVQAAKDEKARLDPTRPGWGSAGKACFSSIREGLATSPQHRSPQGSRKGDAISDLSAVVARARAKVGAQSTQDEATRALIRASCPCDALTERSEGGKSAGGAAAPPTQEEIAARAMQELSAEGWDEEEEEEEAPSKKPGVDAKTGKAIIDEHDLDNLKSMFRRRASTTAETEEMHPHTFVDESVARDGMVSHRAMIAHTFIFSLSEEYAVLVLQERWRERKRRRSGLSHGTASA